MLKKYLIIFALLLLAPVAQATMVDGQALSGYAWSSNIGWLSFNYPSSYAWSTNIGWVNFGNVNFDGTKFTGFAQALSASGTSGWDGQISLGNQPGQNYGVTVSGSGLDGYAWGDVVIGWLDFKRVSLNNSLTASCLVSISGNDVTLDAGPVSGGSNAYDYNWSILGQPPVIDHATSVQVTLPDGNGYTAQLQVIDQNDPSKSTTVGCAPSPFDVGVVGGFSDPTVTISAKNRLEINSQPLTSPAISSYAQFAATPGSLTNPVIKIISMGSTRSAVDLLDDANVSCALRVGLSGYTSPSNFTSCRNASAPLGFGNNDVYLNLKVNRPTQTLKDNSPYQVVVEVSGDQPGHTASNQADPVGFFFNVGTVNPI